MAEKGNMAFVSFTQGNSMGTEVIGFMRNSDSNHNSAVL